MEFWGVFFLMVVLKIPLVALIWLVWWAIRQTPDEWGSESGGGGDGGSRVDHPRGPLPRPPRRGEHDEPAPASPPRVRTAIARTRTLER